MPSPRSQPALSKAFPATGFALFAGFGGLLVLMAVAGFGALGVLEKIENSNAAIRREYVARNRALEEIRSDVYLSGTYIRDYLLDPDPAGAAAHLASLRRVRALMDNDLRQYQRRLRPGESGPVEGLRAELARYWQVMDPVLQWRPEERRKRGFPFLRDEIFPRRMSMLALADQIATVNEKQLHGGESRVSDLFARFRMRLMLTVALTFGLGLLLAALSIRTLLRLAREAAARYDEILHARTELKELSARLVEAQENERRSIARELHDEVGQALTAVLLELGNLSAAVNTGSSQELREHIAIIRRLAENSVAVVRNMSLLLRPSMLDDLGLVPALQWQAREVSRRTGMLVNVEADNVSDEMPEDFKTCIYRVVQEALQNVSRHAGARRVEVSVRQGDEELVLSVQDDGRGFEPRIEKGIGLLGMQERVEHLHGTFHVDSRRGGGTRIHIALPLRRSPARAVTPV